MKQILLLGIPNTLEKKPNKITINRFKEKKLNKDYHVIAYYHNSADFTFKILGGEHIKSVNK